MQTTLARDLFNKLKPQETQELKTQKIEHTPALEPIVQEFDQYADWHIDKQMYFPYKFTIQENAHLSACDIATFCSALPAYQHLPDFSLIAGDFVNLLIHNCTEKRIVLNTMCLS